MWLTHIPLRLEPSGAEVIPGQSLDCRLRIYNSSEFVDEFTASGVGDAAEWVSVSPAKLQLLPAEEGEWEVTVTIPPDATLEAGAHVIHLRVDSSLEDVEPQTEDLTVYIEEVTRAEVRVEPARRVDASAATYDVLVANWSNHPILVELSADDPQDSVRADVWPGQVEVPAFQTGYAHLSVRIDGPSADAETSYPLEVEGRIEEAGRVPELLRSAPVTFVHRPRRIRPWMWVAGIAALVLLVALIAVVGWRQWNTQAVLERGDRGAQVARWQTALNATIDAGLVVDGSFGPRTESATRDFQRAVGLPESGVVDRRTLSAMEDVLGGPRGSAAAETRDRGGEKALAEG